MIINNKIRTYSTNIENDHLIVNIIDDKFDEYKGTISNDELAAQSHIIKNIEHLNKFIAVLNDNLTFNYDELIYRKYVVDLDETIIISINMTKKELIMSDVKNQMIYELQTEIQKMKQQNDEIMHMMHKLEKQIINLNFQIPDDDYIEMIPTSLGICHEVSNGIFKVTQADYKYEGAIFKLKFNEHQNAKINIRFTYRYENNPLCLQYRNNSYLYPIMNKTNLGKGVGHMSLVSNIKTISNSNDNNIQSVTIQYVLYFTKKIEGYYQVCKEGTCDTSNRSQQCKSINITQKKYDLSHCGPFVVGPWESDTIELGISHMTGIAECVIAFN